MFTDETGGARLANRTGEHQRVPSSSRFDRADTDIGTERGAVVRRLVSSAAWRERRLRAAGPDDISKRDRKRELRPGCRCTDGIRS